MLADRSPSSLWDQFERKTPLFRILLGHRSVVVNLCFIYDYKTVQAIQLGVEKWQTQYWKLLHNYVCGQSWLKQHLSWENIGNGPAIASTNSRSLSLRTVNPKQLIFSIFSECSEINDASRTLGISHARAIATKWTKLLFPD